MRDFRRQVQVLSTLHQLTSEPELVATFRQGMASLAQVALDAAAAPFEGSEPEALLASVQTMLARALLDDLSFLPSASATTALYALASALPPNGQERRELGRRVLAQLQVGDADSFVALATALALGSTRAFEGAQMRARIELMLCVPARTVSQIDALAFAMLSRRELCTRFFVEPSTQDLPARRMAARLLEAAARYAALRAKQGDDCELSAFAAPHVHALFAQLLLDKEPAVFRHAASARGLLSGALALHADDLDADLAARDAPSRMRRGAISLAARLSVHAGDALERALELLRGPAMQRDPGLAAALIHGLSRVIELEPELAERLLVEAVTRGGALAVEALLDLRRELHADDYCERATRVALAQLTQIGESGAADADQLEHLAMLREALEPEQAQRGERLTEQLGEALLTYARDGAQAALAPALTALATATRHVEHLALLDASQGRRARRELFRLLYELDVGLLESSALFDLLSASAPSDATRPSAQLTTLLMRLLSAVMAHEELPHQGDGPVPHLALRMRRLRLLMHLLDTDYKPGDEQLTSVREQQLSAVRRLSTRIANDAPSAMDRVVHAVLARGVESLVRSESFELADALLCLVHAVPRSEGLFAVAEGCLLPELKRALRAAFALQQALEGPTTPAPVIVASLLSVAHALPSDDSPRTEALRRALLALERALEALLAAQSIRELTRSRRALTLFEGALIELAYLNRGAQRRLGERPDGVVIEESPVAGLTRALESAAAQGARADLGPTLEWLDRELSRALPLPFALAISRVLGVVRDWPLESQEPASRAPAQMASTEACPLPAWIPASRRLGGFSVVRPLGAGLASSVFLVQRTDERSDDKEAGLALKVPRYDARAARVLSASQFEAAFARELPALLSVPPHEHLASFVAVESKSAPKPFVVMEWIEGPTLARVRKRQLDPFALLDGVLSGLEVLHALGIGHLDVTPSRVVLRTRGSELLPVLVDFGLAGRNVRAGCGDAAYRAPELWRDDTAGVVPCPADVYAVGCLAYELVTGRPLFHGARDGQVAALHAAHDGVPEPVAELAREPRHARLAEWVALCLRADPALRPAVSELRKTLRFIAASEQRG